MPPHPWARRIFTAYGPEIESGVQSITRISLVNLRWFDANSAADNESV